MSFTFEILPKFQCVHVGVHVCGDSHLFFFPIYMFSKLSRTLRLHVSKRTNVFQASVAACFDACHVDRTQWRQRRSPNAVNSGVKVAIVVINKHAQRDLVFDKKVKEQAFA